MRLLRLLLSLLVGIGAAHVIHPLTNGIALPIFIFSLALLVTSFYYNHFSIWLWIILCAYCWASHDIDQHTTLDEVVTCQATIQLMDFPKPVAPSGEVVTAKIIASIDCPVQDGAAIRVRAYKAPHWQINKTYHSSLKFIPTRAVSLGKTGVEAYSNLLSLTPANMAQIHTISQWRKTVSTLIDKRYDTRTQRWWQALLIGNRTLLDYDDWLLLRRTGTVHLLAISGLHLAIVAGMAFWLLQMLWAQSRTLSVRVEPRSAALIGALVIALVYSLISGAQPPVLRAWIMFAIFTLHWFYAPIRSGIQALLLTAILLLIADTYLIFSVSAWLSFYATAIVILSYRRLKNHRALSLWVSLQGIITLAMWPLVWALFGGVSLLAFVVNLIVIPWLGVMLILGYLGLIVPIIANLADAIFARYLHTIYFFANYDVAYLSVNWQPNVWVAACICLAMILWLAPTKRIGKYASFAIMLFAILLAMLAIRPKNEYHVLQRSPLLAVIRHDKHTYLINAGYKRGNLDQAQTTIITYLRLQGITPQTLIITDNSKRATTALATLVKHYPDINLYSIVLTQDVPFDIEYCPADSSPPLNFIKGRYCEVHIGNTWQIKRDGITARTP